MQNLKLKIKNLILNSQFSLRRYSGQASLKYETGQALITLLFFALIGVIITTTAVMIAITNRLSIQKVEHGMTAYSIAESGMENALLQILRNPFYTGETLVVGDGFAVSTVTGSSTKTILSIGSIGNYKRTIQVQVSYTNNVMSILSWEEQ